MNKNLLNGIVDYIRKGEKQLSEYKIGMEAEHFLIHKDSNRTVTYSEEGGLKHLFEQLSKNDGVAEYEGDNVLRVKCADTSVTLEPGGQLEIDINPFSSINRIEALYLDTLNKIDTIASKQNQVIVSTGYHPASRIISIPLLPKRRYEYMYRYFKTRGSMAHNMMKGTAALQISVDYSNEQDFISKVKVASFLSPIIYFFLDNVAIFEGELSGYGMMRKRIWDNCDVDRSRYIPRVFSGSFGYESYAEFILNMSSIVCSNKKGLVYTGNTPIKDVINIEDKNSIIYALSMTFTDVRVKSYIEIRPADALPYPYNISYATFIKGLFYNKSAINYINSYISGYTLCDVIEMEKDIIANGYNAGVCGMELYEFLNQLVELAKQSLTTPEKNYLKPLEYLIHNMLTPRDKTLRKIVSNNSKEPLRWCMYSKRY